MEEKRTRNLRVIGLRLGHEVDRAGRLIQTVSEVSGILTTPTISNARLIVGLAPKDLPMGSSFRKNLRANASFTTATFRESAVSRSEKPRPCTMGVPTASK